MEFDYFLSKKWVTFAYGIRTETDESVMKRLFICLMTTMKARIITIIVTLTAACMLTSCFKESEEITGSLNGVWYLAGHTREEDLTEDKEPEMVWITPTSPDPESGFVIMELTSKAEELFDAAFYQLPPSYFAGNNWDFWNDYPNYPVSESQLSLRSMTTTYAGSTWKITYVSEKEIILNDKCLVDGGNTEKDYNIVFRKLK